ncbi:ceramidase [Rhodocollybia butyracea]|uniref:Ceramidase n=1 Tax=Rhodocollybia butyracea TaxID=206335 RepID=A0A9P5Q4F8_9AGAR|nr:ceramidase [Rhodocollybia butyracea]
MTLLSKPNELSRDGFFGPITASLDWCEANYQFSYYIAEMANTFSNFFTLYFAILAGRNLWRESIPGRFIMGCLGFAIVGVGSFAFHASLLFEAQLADELPMIFVSSMSLWFVWDCQPGFSLSSTETKLQITALILFNLLFSWSYILYRNPIYHQLVFATLVLSVTFRVTYLLNWSPFEKQIPEDKKRIIASMFTTGALTFLAGFFIWNLDNMFCDILTGWKRAVGWPAAFLLEGHAWWHLLTGLGSYYMFLGTQYM